MSTQAAFLACYEAIADATQGMRDAARAADWSAFAQHERGCSAWIARAEALGDPDRALDSQGRRRRFELLRRMLRDDAEIRDLTEPRLGRVDRCIGRPAGSFVAEAR
ncbi:MAG TPA: flagellar protein FliT [Casimicrobiaceae bacterium]|jgi:flagellar protein FliT